MANLTVPRVELATLTYFAHAPQLALALQEAGMLTGWYTGVYAGTLAGNAMAKMLQPLNKRIVDDLDESHVVTLPAWELLRIAVTRAPGIPLSISERGRHFCFDGFGKSVGARLQERSPDIVISANPGALYVLQGAKKIGCLAVLSQRTLHPITMQRQVESELRRQGLSRHKFLHPSHLKNVEKHVEEIELADYIFCPTPSVIDSMLSNGVPEKKLILVPYGVDLSRFEATYQRRVASSAKEKRDIFRVLFVGTVSVSKGVNYLIKAFEELQLPSAELILVGKQSDDIQVNHVGQHHGPISMAGWVEPSNLDAYYESADLFVFPSLAEGAGRVVYEAMASGLPVIVTKPAGDFVRDGKDGYVVPTHNLEALKERIQTLYDDHHARVTMGKSAHEHVQALSWDNYRSRIGEVLSEIWSDWTG